MATRAFSLVEQKKQQWAKEREEMVGLCGFWGMLSNRRQDERRPSIKTHYVSSYDLRRPDDSPEHSESSLDNSDKFGRRRSPSLPPIYKQNYQEENSCDGEEGETSGYASDSGDRQEYQPSWSHKSRSRQPSAWQYSNMNTPDSLNSEGGRMRWGDKGVGVGHLWDPSLHNPEARLPAVTDRPGPTPPAWLCRATNNTVSEVLVISHPEVTSPITDYGSCDTMSNSERSFIRGQNIMIDSEELMERERKRQKAKELQDAIRQQLEERERKRKEEREQRQKEERLEEERLMKQREMERKRLEEEQRRQREKEMKEEKKEKAMREALETAERRAKEDKMKTRKKHKPEPTESTIQAVEEKIDRPYVVGKEIRIARVDVEETKPLEVEEKPVEVRVREEAAEVEEKTSVAQVTEGEKSSEESEPLTRTGAETANVDVNTAKPNLESESLRREPFHQDLLEKTSFPQEVFKKESFQQESFKQELFHKEPAQQESFRKEPYQRGIYQKELSQTESSSDDQEVDVEPDSLDEDTGQGVALVLSEAQEVEVNQLSLIVSPGRLLTPTKFRTNPSYEKGTQTEMAKSEVKLPLRKRLEERPKWGVNRPETQYIKQSERDPYYQTRIRRNLGRTRGKPSKLERDSSRSPSPVSPMNMKIQGNQQPVTMVSRGTVTPRVMQMMLPSTNAFRQAHSRYLSFKGGVGAVVASNMFKLKSQSRPPPPQPPSQINLVKDVLNQLTSLRQGLNLKQHEWDVSRSQTPFSEISSVSN